MAAKYPVTYRELLIAIKKAKCAITVLNNEDITTSLDDLPTDANQNKILEIRSILWALENYNFEEIELEDIVPCIDESELSFLVQRINTIAAECGCPQSFDVIVPEVGSYLLDNDGNFILSNNGFRIII